MPISAAVDQSPDLRVPHLAKLLQWRAEEYPNQLAYTFLESDGTEQRLTYGELDRRARIIATAVRVSGGAGQRVLIVCPPGLDYIAAFFGCLYADAIAVPAYSPTTSRASRTLPRLQAIVADAQAALALTTSAAREVVTGIYQQAPELDRLSWIIVDDLDVQSEIATLPEPSQSLAFLMYTSGSTGVPKGVMVGHANALHNAAAFPGFRSRHCQSIVSWLPLFHDLGLFLGVIHPLYQGVPAVLMSPADFVRHPLRWLEAMSRFGGTTTGGPNFAYELCVRKTTEEQRSRLDLSSWNLALNGAEPIRPETLKRFAETFAAAGFRPEAFYPSYGLADATATVTGSSDFGAPYVLSLNRQELAQRRVSLAEPNDPLALTLVGCGGGLDQQVIRIVDPNTSQPCAADAVGEIWVSGPSIGQGYWNRPEETERVFGARLAEDSERTYLRTGDLGFLHGGELFIAGRLRDLIIIRGQNYYPEDIELTVEHSHPLLRAGCGAAFALDVDGEERLAIVHEIEDPTADPAAIIAAIRRVVIEYYDVLTHRIVLIGPGTIPKTSSGKIQRSTCRAQLLDGTLKPVANWQHERAMPAARSASEPTTIERWITDWLARQIGIEVVKIDRRAPLSSYDLDSMSAMTLIGELEQWLGRQLSPTLVWSYPSIEALAAYLAGKTRPAETAGARAQPQEHDPIAIIGMGCRLPGAPDVEAFWRLLMDQGDAITEIPASRWDAAALYSSDSLAPGKLTTRWGGFLADADAFDAQLFGISPREAAHIDPQQRLLLEVAWAALEHAGEAPDSLAGSATGVFMGICNSDHARLELEDREAITQYGGTGTSYSLVANRLSYTFDLRGPSIAIDTACSSSLVALHLACQSLRSGECDRALAGGVNLILSPEISIAFSKARMMAADGHCKTFDAGADGYVRSEGVGVLVLKRLSQALADGDRVLALVQGTAINQDGRSNGITAPNGLAQQAVIRQAFRQAGISPAQVGYIEAHGTGTPLGDAIEIAAWDAVLGRQAERIPIGSVKTNLGHTEAAAGVAGVIKTVLAMQHGCIPPQLYGHNPNLQVNPQTSALEVVLTARSWDTAGDRRFASVSSFGFGGTNAHAVLEALLLPGHRGSMQDRSHHMLMLSGRDERALIEQAQQFSRILANSDPATFADICYTVNRGRAHLSQRLALVADTRENAAGLLSQVIGGQETGLLWRGEVTGRAEPVAFVFTGQGPQYVQMARQLYESHPGFRATLEECQRLLEPHVDVPLLSYLYPAPGDSVLAEDDWRLQPALFAIEYALAQLWISWGVQPAVVLGHSMGEYVAACVAGVFSLADALKLVTYRAKLVERLPKDGAMAAVLAPAAVVHQHLARFNGAISVASYNSASLVIVSGAKAALQALGEDLQQAEISFRPLPISNAFHSPAMRPIVADFAAIAASVSYSAPKIALVANLTGTLANPDQLGADYWVQHLLEPVQFQQSIECLVEQQYRIFVEMGPRPTLTNTIKRIVPGDPSYLILASLSGHADQPDWLMLMSALGQISVRGIEIDWRAVDQPYQRSVVSLPTYPFERQRYPIGRAERKLQATPQTRRPHPLIDQEIVAPQIEGAIFQCTLSATGDSFLSDHQVRGAAVLPAVAQIEMMLAAAALSSVRPPTGIAQLALTAPLTVADTALVQVALAPSDQPGSRAASVVSRTAQGSWQTHATAEILQDQWSSPPLDPDELRRRCATQLTSRQLYDRFAGTGIEYGLSFQSIRQIWLGNGEVFAEIALDTSTHEGYRLPPALLDGALQTLAVLWDSSGGDATFVPFALDQLRLLSTDPLPSRLFCYGVRTGNPTHELRSADLTLLREDGRVEAVLCGVKLRQLPRLAAQAPAVDQWLYRPRWQPRALPLAKETKRRTWLIFADALGVGAALCAHLTTQGDRCVTVQAGERFGAVAAGYTLRPDHHEDYTALVEALAGQTIDAVAHLWSCTPPLSFAETEAEIEGQLTGGARSLLHLIQALSAWSAMPELLAVVSSYAQAVDEASQRPVNPLKAALWGVAKVVALEYPATNVVAVDLETIGHDPAELAAAAVAECQARLPGGSWIVYADGQRLEQRLEPVSVRQSDLPLREGGVYLISGGQNGVGLEIARWIARQVRATLVLLNRTPLDATRMPERAQGLGELEALGATVEAVAGDVADVDQLTALVESIVAQHGALNGVFHAAGVLDDSMIWNMDRSRFDRVLRPKVHGTWALAQATRNLSLDCLVICSSMAALSPSPGQSNHVAANAVQDSLAHWLRRSGVPALSINWGLWGETGVVATPRYLQTLRARGIYPLTNVEAIAGLEAALRSGLPQVAFYKDQARLAEKQSSTSLAQQADRLADEQRLFQMAEATGELDRLCSRYVARALWSLGFNPLLHSRFTTEQLAAQLQVLPQHQRLFARLLAMLVEDGSLVTEGDTYSLRGMPDVDGIDEVAAALALKYPGLASEIALLRRCGDELAAALTGRRDPLSLLFPAGSQTNLESMYESSPFAHVYNNLAATVIEQIASEQRPLRVLEVGAGTGGTTSYILSALAGRDVEYTFSDLSNSFLEKARRKYQQHADLRYKLLNIEHDLVAQGEQPLSYQAIVAANVVHATADIAATLTRLSQLLAPDGTLVLVELVRPQRWLDLTFGLTGGWWKAQDTALRPDYPLLDPERWQTILSRLGFGEITIVKPENTGGALPVEQAVIVARRPAIIGDQTATPLPGQQTVAVAPQPTVTSDPEDSTNPRRWLQGLIRAQVIRSLKLNTEQIPASRSFHDLGLDSLLAVEIAQALRRELEIQLSPTIFFEYPSIRALANFIWQSHGEAVQRVFAIHNPAPDTSAVEVASTQQPERQPQISQPVAGVRRQDIAIVGMDCRFPGAHDLQAFWQLLYDGVDAVSEIPPDRWDWREYFAAQPGADGKTYSRWGGYLRDIDRFDARFFNISPKEAALMDPQQRLFLESAWHALEHAGYAGDALAGSNTGVFVGCSYNHYLQVLSRAQPQQAISHYTALGNNHSILANRASFFLNLNGPSVVIDTLCSSSLTALHTACRSIQNGECDAALVGGVNLLLNPEHYLSLSQMRAYAADGRCKTFDQRADGFVSGEGVATIMIKPLERALADGDAIYAVVKGSAVNHNGRTNGLTAPHATHQAAVIRRAHTEAGWDRATVGYIEAHGTGTALGDPIEINGLSAVFPARPADATSCYLGSVKTNIGHLEPVAGLAGLIKVVLAMHHGIIPPTLHFETANPHIDFVQTPFKVNTAAVEWTANGPRRAGVSAFGLGGVNAHIALEEAPTVLAAADTAEYFLLPLSAMSEAALDALIRRYYAHLIAAPQQRLTDMCFTAAVGRAHLRHRLAIIATSRIDLIDKLQAILAGLDKHKLQTMGIFYGDVVSLESHDGLAAPVGNLSSQTYADLVTLAESYVAGTPIDWPRIYAGAAARRVMLPAYPFEKERHWFEESAAPRVVRDDAEPEAPDHDDQPFHPLLGIRLP